MKLILTIKHPNQANQFYTDYIEVPDDIENLEDFIKSQVEEQFGEGIFFKIETEKNDIQLTEADIKQRQEIYAFWGQYAPADKLAANVVEDSLLVSLPSERTYRTIEQFLSSLPLPVTVNVAIKKKDTNAPLAFRNSMMSIIKFLRASFVAPFKNSLLLLTGKPITPDNPNGVGVNVAPAAIGAPLFAEHEKPFAEMFYRDLGVDPKQADRSDYIEFERAVAGEITALLTLENSEANRQQINSYLVGMNMKPLSEEEFGEIQAYLLKLNSLDKIQTFIWSLFSNDFGKNTELLRRAISILKNDPDHILAQEVADITTIDHDKAAFIVYDYELKNNIRDGFYQDVFRMSPAVQKLVHGHLKMHFNIGAMAQGELPFETVFEFATRYFNLCLQGRTSVQDIEDIYFPEQVFDIMSVMGHKASLAGIYDSLRHSLIKACLHFISEIKELAHTRPELSLAEQRTEFRAVIRQMYDSAHKNMAALVIDDLSYRILQENYDQHEQLALSRILLSARTRKENENLTNAIFDAYDVLKQQAPETAVRLVHLLNAGYNWYTYQPDTFANMGGAKEGTLAQRYLIGLAWFVEFATQQEAALTTKNIPAERCSGHPCTEKTLRLESLQIKDLIDKVIKQEKEAEKGLSTSVDNPQVKILLAQNAENRQILKTGGKEEAAPLRRPRTDSSLGLGVMGQGIIVTAKKAAALSTALPQTFEANNNLGKK